MPFDTDLPLGTVLNLLFSAYVTKSTDHLPFKVEVVDKNQDLSFRISLKMANGDVVHVHRDDIFISPAGSTTFNMHYSRREDKGDSYSYNGNDWFTDANGEISYRSYDIFGKRIAKNTDSNDSNVKSCSVTNGNTFTNIHYRKDTIEKMFSCNNMIGSMYFCETYDITTKQLLASSITIRRDGDFNTIQSSYNNDGNVELEIKFGLSNPESILLPVHEPSIGYLWNKYVTFQLEVGDEFVNFMNLRDVVLSDMKAIYAPEGKSAVFGDIIRNIEELQEADYESGI